MNYGLFRQVEADAARDRLTVAHAKNAACVVCSKTIAAAELHTALLLEQNERLAHPGACSAEALRHAFAFASRGLRGRRSHRSSR